MHATPRTLWRSLPTACTASRIASSTIAPRSAPFASSSLRTVQQTSRRAYSSQPPKDKNGIKVLPFVALLGVCSISYILLVNSRNGSTWQPFHLSSTGRKEKAAPLQPPAPTATPQQPVKPPALNTKQADEVKKEGKVERSPKTPGVPKPKRKKSKIVSGGASGGTNTAATTPAAS
ncbi:hypothetical protein HYQ44_016521 [Verticillium longisporum]|nr:hypothetical protein HYQ44_016521 [Verticillium longisporum]